MNEQHHRFPEPREDSRRVKFVSVATLAREDGGDLIVAVDKIGLLWLGEVTDDPTKPKWSQVKAPDGVTAGRFRD